MAGKRESGLVFLWQWPTGHFRNITIDINATQSGRQQRDDDKCWQIRTKTHSQMDSWQKNGNRRWSVPLFG